MVVSGRPQRSDVLPAAPGTVHGHTQIIHAKGSTMSQHRHGDRSREQRHGRETGEGHHGRTGYANYREEDELGRGGRDYHGGSRGEHRNDEHGYRPGGRYAEGPQGYDPGGRGMPGEVDRGAPQGQREQNMRAGEWGQRGAQGPWGEGGFRGQQGQRQGYEGYGEHWGEAGEGHWPQGSQDPGGFEQWSHQGSHGQGGAAYGAGGEHPAPRGRGERRAESGQDRRRGGASSGRFDPHYLQWREEQIRKLDADYEAWNKERYGKFSEEFDAWRRGREGGAQNLHEAATSSPGRQPEGEANEGGMGGVRASEDKVGQERLGQERLGQDKMDEERARQGGVGAGAFANYAPEKPGAEPGRGTS